MIFRISHRTTYRFSRDVFLEPHIVRLRPRCDSFQELREYDLKVAPGPAGRSDGLDAEGNAASLLWFEGLTRELEILAEATVRTLRSDPFDYLLTRPETTKFPVSYEMGDLEALGPYLRHGESEDIRKLARELALRAGHGTLAFLNELNATLFRNWKVVVREEGAPLDPCETLKRSEASCRDLTVLFMEVCRGMGIACRFVSGYQEGDRQQVNRFMHAWPEVYLPGAGWRGYDPTHGLVVADRHVALASGAVPLLAAPTQGSFRGTGATSAMEIALSIETEP